MKLEYVIILLVVMFFIYFLFIGIIYIPYQYKRNQAVYAIRTKWIENNDKRLFNYSYDDMFEPSFRNFYGLKYPKEKHFK